MMLTRKTQPLEMAKEVLGEEKVTDILRSPSFNYRAYLILDRWAVNEPEQLKQLADNPGYLGMILLRQQAMEHEALTSDEGLRYMNDQGMSDYEVLQLMQIPMHIRKM